MRAINNKGTVLENRGKLVIDTDDELFVYKIGEVNKISILTTRQLLLNSHVFLVLDVKNDVFLMTLGHDDFKDVIFKELPRLFEIDNTQVIDAMQNTGYDHEYILYSRGNRNV